MTDPAGASSAEGLAENAAAALGLSVLGREMTGEERKAMVSILKATTQALEHGFITRLADHVLAEREDEAVEEFFENINPD